MSDRLRILFVDDEPNVLAGLTRMLRPMREEWQVDTAPDGPSALKHLAESPVDVLVSDMRMPGMDGATLLAATAERHPGVIRILLSGQSDSESLLRSIGPTHQYLAKPCDPQALRASIGRACRLRDQLKVSGLINLVAQIGSLPPLPEIYTAVLAELRTSQPSMRRIAENISRDIGMSAKLLQIVNSARFGTPRHISSPVDATLMLGLDTIRSLILTIHLFDTCGPDAKSGLSASWLWQHSLAVGHLAKAIAHSAHQPAAVVETAFSAGLLHDCGLLLLAVNLPERFAHAVQLSNALACPLDQIEIEVFGANHAALGGYLLGLWGLPDALVEAVAYHHQPSTCHATVFTPLTAVHLAESVLPNGAEGIPQAAARLDERHIAELGISECLPEWRRLAADTGACRGGDND